MPGASRCASIHSRSRPRLAAAHREEAGYILELAQGPAEPRPFELRQDDVFRGRHEQRQPVEVDQEAGVELGPAVRAGLPADEVDLPAGGQVDQVELRFVAEGRQCGGLVGVVLVSRQIAKETPDLRRRWAMTKSKSCVARGRPC